MMCSGSELDLGEDADGIMDLDSNFEMGTPLADALNLNDPVIDFEVTPNRPDWLGVDSIARDLAAVGLGKVITKPVETIKGSFPCPVEIKTDVPDTCPAFVGRVIKGLKNGPSPRWLQDQLKAIGLRPISALVDITNFITYDRARPLHFYDVTKLKGGITVRMGKNEKFDALDDKAYEASSDVVVAGDIPTPPPAIKFDTALNQRLTGLKLSDKEMTNILTDLGFTVGKDWTVKVPTWRRDATQGADLVEEIVRIHGFHNLEAISLPPLPGRREPTATITQNRTRLARRALAVRGLSEAITWSFVLQDHAKLFGGGEDKMLLDNPISSDLDCMRPTALIHLLLAGQRNADKGYPRAAQFELGPVYRGTEPNEQALTLAGMRRTETERHWAGECAVDALSAKADALAALEAMGANVSNLQMSKPTGEYWHPGRSGRLQMGPKNILADFGELHPRVLKALGIESRVVAFEISRLSHEI